MYEGRWHKCSIPKRRNPGSLTSTLKGIFLFIFLRNFISLMCLLSNWIQLSFNINAKSITGSLSGVYSLQCAGGSRWGRIDSLELPVDNFYYIPVCYLFIPALLFQPHIITGVRATKIKEIYLYDGEIKPSDLRLSHFNNFQKQPTQWPQVTRSPGFRHEPSISDKYAFCFSLPSNDVSVDVQRRDGGVVRVGLTGGYWWRATVETSTNSDRSPPPTSHHHRPRAVKTDDSPLLIFCTISWFEARTSSQINKLPAFSMQTVNGSKPNFSL